MDFKTFKTKVQVLDGGEKIREKYIQEFVNTNHELYHEQIQQRYKFIDGYCYLGYLWDYIKDAVVVHKQYIEEIAEIKKEVYVFWDIHSCERILIKNYWRFDKNTVLKLDFKTLLEGEEYLPEDIYIFDATISWTLIKTHENINGNCFCLKSGGI